MGNDYEVGYGKPPKEHRFKPGQSGNSRGRPRKLKVLFAVINEPVPIKINGVTRMAPGYEVGLRKTAQAALAGDLRAIKRFIAECDKIGLLKGAHFETMGTALIVPRDFEFGATERTDAEMKRLIDINAERLRALRLRQPISEREAAIVRVANEIIYVASASRKMPVLEVILHKLKSMALKGDDDPALAYFLKLSARDLVDVGNEAGGYILVPEPFTEETTPLQIIDET